MSIRVAVTVVLSFAASLVAQPAPAPQVHGRAFWQHLVDNDGKLPDGESAAALLRELSAYLGSTDPMQRDTFAYSLSEAWIYRDQKLAPADLRERLADWQGNLKLGLGEQGTDSVLRRSFSALELSLIAAYDLKAPFLTQAEYDALLDAALDYLAAERDVRGYDPEKGWMHSVAHTADLLKFLARNPRLAPAGQARILSAIAAKLEATGPLVHGEDERLARAVLSLVRRADFDAAAFRAWHSAYPAKQKALWSAPRLDPAGYAALGNAKHLLVSLYSLLAQVKEPAPGLLAARDELLTTLGGL
jgi:hypothetical protein